MSSTKDFFREQHAIARAAVERDAAADTTGLRCDKCGAVPSPGMPAQAGGTHYRRVYHGEGIPGRRYNSAGMMKKCGTWRAREPGEEG